MMSFPGSPRILKAGIVLLDPFTLVSSIVVLQYNPDQLTRTLQVQARRGERRPFGGAAAEGAADRDVQAGSGDRRHRPAGIPRRRTGRDEVGIFPQLAALETLIYAAVPADLRRDGLRRRAAPSRSLPMEAPLALFVWSVQRVVPVRVTEFSITEEAFDAALNPIRAKVSLGTARADGQRPRLRHTGAAAVHGYLKNKEALALRAPDRLARTDSDWRLPP